VSSLPLLHVSLSGDCSACMEQSATRDLGLLLTFDIPEGDQVSPFSSVIRLTWHRILRWSANVCIELCNSFRSRFCKVPPQLCDGSTVIHDICSNSSSRSSSSSLYLELAPDSRDVWNRIFLFSFGFSLVFEKKTWIRFRMSLVRFRMKNEVRFGYYCYLVLICNS